MESGFVPDYSYASILPLKWMEGAAEKGLLGCWGTSRPRGGARSRSRPNGAFAAVTWNSTRAC